MPEVPRVTHAATHSLGEGHEMDEEVWVLPPADKGPLAQAKVLLGEEECWAWAEEQGGMWHLLPPSGSPHKSLPRGQKHVQECYLTAQPLMSVPASGYLALLGLPALCWLFSVPALALGARVSPGLLFCPLSALCPAIGQGHACPAVHSGHA